MNTLTINSSALTGIYVDAALSFNKPAKRVETFSVPGRNGDLIIDEGTFDNVLITYPCYEPNTFPTYYDTAVNTLAALRGYLKIECSNDSTHFRRGRFIVPSDPVVKRVNKDGFFDLAFDCKPPRWLTSGETVTTLSASGTITNPSKFASQPLIRIYGTGKVTVSGTEITVASHNQSYVDVDCEMMDCFCGTTNMNSYVSFSTNDFPTLASGSNTITLGTGITQVKITPRWWEL